MQSYCNCPTIQYWCHTFVLFSNKLKQVQLDLHTLVMGEHLPCTSVIGICQVSTYSLPSFQCNILSINILPGLIRQFGLLSNLTLQITWVYQKSVKKEGNPSIILPHTNTNVIQTFNLAFGCQLNLIAVCLRLRLFCNFSFSGKQKIIKMLQLSLRLLAGFVGIA